MTSSPRFAAAPTTPIFPAERYYVAPQLDATRAEARILETICDGAFRPPDAAKAAKIEEVFALFVPFWRMDVQRTDESLAVTQVHVGTVGVPIPKLRSKEARATCMACARTSFPYEMKNPKTLITGDAKPLVVSLAALLHGDPEPSAAWEIVDADVPESRARSVCGAVLAGSERSDELYTQTELTVHAVHFVRYPIWFARYRYDGVAAKPGDLFHVGVSAVDGVCVTASHPSKLKAAAAKVKRFFGAVGSVGSFAPFGKKDREEPTKPREEAPTDVAASAPKPTTSQRPVEPKPATTERPAEPKPGAGTDFKSRFQEHVKRGRRDG